MILYEIEKSDNFHGQYNETNKLDRYLGMNTYTHFLFK